jgi:hypothetical protein
VSLLLFRLSLAGLIASLLLSTPGFLCSLFSFLLGTANGLISSSPSFALTLPLLLSLSNFSGVLLLALSF